MFAEILKKCRKNKGVTQKDVANYLGIKERSYQNYEYGNSEAPYDTLVRLADYFNVSTDYLLGRSDDPTRH